LLDYGRHFIVLLALSLGLIGLRLAGVSLAPGWARMGAGMEWEFAMYGTLYGLALLSTLRMSPVRMRKLAFLVASAALSCLVAASSVTLLRLLAQHGGTVAVLAAAAALGALLYAGAIRALLAQRIALRAAAFAALVCAAAEAAAYLVAQHRASAFGLTLALPWWLAFSGALWASEARRAR
jgi:hypothetical protein